MKACAIQSSLGGCDGRGTVRYLHTILNGHLHTGYTLELPHLIHNISPNGLSKTLMGWLMPLAPNGSSAIQTLSSQQATELHRELKMVYSAGLPSHPFFSGVPSS